jgi:hypothetical protein
LRWNTHSKPRLSDGVPKRSSRRRIQISESGLPCAWHYSLLFSTLVRALLHTLPPTRKAPSQLCEHRYHHQDRRAGENKKSSSLLPNICNSASSSTTCTPHYGSYLHSTSNTVNHVLLHQLRTRMPRAGEHKRRPMPGLSGMCTDPQLGLVIDRYGSNASPGRLWGFDDRPLSQQPTRAIFKDQPSTCRCCCRRIKPSTMRGERRERDAGRKHTVRNDLRLREHIRRIYRAFFLLIPIHRARFFGK